jgi:DNA polymerase (family X)
MTNQDIAEVLDEMALRLAAEGVRFKPAVYQKAADAVRALGRPLAEDYEAQGARALLGIPGVGQSIAQKIEELLRSGRLEELSALRQRLPADIVAMTGVEGLGPRTARELYEELKITNLEELEAAAQAGKIRKLPHFGVKSEENLLAGIASLRKAQGRQPLEAVLPFAREVEARLRAIPGVEAAVVVGSIRRQKPTVGDMDFLVVSRAPKRVIERFAAMPEVERVLAKGPTKALVHLTSGLDADLRVVPAKSFGAALCYFTGSKAHNLALRRLAIKKGLKLNEYGLFRGEKMIAGRTEEELYAALGLPYIPPTHREDEGELEAALQGRHGAPGADLQP